MAKLQLILIKNKIQYDITQLLISAKWDGKKGSAPRTLQITLLDDKNFTQSGINIENGPTCIFKVDGSEVFRGVILKQEDSSSGKKMSCKAYDLGIYLSNNKDTFSFTNKRADQIFKNLCKRCGISTGTVSNTGYVIGELVQSKKKDWDLLLSALSKTYKHTGIRYYIRADKGKLNLLRRSDDVVNLILETGRNVQSYKQSRSYEKVNTRAVCYNDDNKLIAWAKNTSLEKVIGIFQDEVSYDDEKNNAQLRKLCETMVNENSKMEHSVDVTVTGNISLISGRCVNVILKPIGVSRKFYIDSDTHSFSANGDYKTSLKLNRYNEFEWKDDKDE